MPVEYFLRYKGNLYDVGTKIRFKSSNKSWASTLEGTIDIFSAYQIFIKLTDGTYWELSRLENLEELIIEILHPVYYRGAIPQKDTRKRPPIGSIDTAWAWYIVLMFAATFVNGNWVLWILISITFFTWKNGLWGGK